MRKYDAVVIGGGHNGLVHAAYLGKAGLKVALLERRPVVGGATITEEIYPGYKFLTASYLISLLSCLLYTSPSPRDQRGSRMPSSA